MTRFLLVSVTAWLAVLAVGVEIALPYMLRNFLKQQAASASDGYARRVVNLRARMWPHYWLGYIILALVLIHSSFVMGPAMGRADAVGIWAATFALCLLFVQLGLGLVMKSGTSPPSTRRWHFWTMIGLVAFILTHVLRNS
jgi:hypothetical protein